MNDLFGKPVSSAVARPKRGRGATPKFLWTADIGRKTNPTGRRRLKYSFRPLSRHGGYANVETSSLSAHLQQSCRLLLEYFTRVGGFRIADDRIVTAFADALNNYKPAEIRAAIRAKAAYQAGDGRQSRRDRLKYLGSPETFCARMENWLLQSGYQEDDRRRKARQRQADRDRRESNDAQRRLAGGSGNRSEAARRIVEEVRGAFHE